MVKYKGALNPEAASIIFLAAGACAAGLIHYKRKALFKKLKKRTKAFRIRAGNIVRERQLLVNEIMNFPDYIFKSMFRVDKETFYEILEKIEPMMPKISSALAARTVKDNKGQTISPQIKLLATLRYLAGGLKWDICFGFKLGWGSFFADSKYGIVWPTIAALNDSYTIGLDFSNDSLKQAADEFAAINPVSANIFNGVVLAIDGWVMQTRQPYQWEIPVTSAINSYRNRKGIWGLVILAGCDASGIFKLFNVANTGSTNDCSAWENSKLKILVEDKSNIFLLTLSITTIYVYL